MPPGKALKHHRCCRNRLRLRDICYWPPKTRERLRCGTVQIQSVPDLAPYYPKGYYSYNPVIKPEEENISRTTRIMRRVAVNYLVNRRNPPGRKILKNKEISEEIGKGFPEYLKNTTTGLRIMTRSRILEVGSGTG